MRRHSFSASAKKRGGQPWLIATAWVFTFAAAAWLLWIVWTPASSKGVLGDALKNTLRSLLGQSAYVLPPLIIYGLYALLREKAGAMAVFFGTALTLASLSCELSVLRLVFDRSLLSGGAVGENFSGLLRRIFGSAGAGLFGLAFLAAGIHVLFRISLVESAKRLAALARDEYLAWKEARAELKNKISEVEIRREPALPPSEPKPAPVEKPAPAAAEKEKPQKEKPPKKQGGFALPPLELLTPPPDGRVVGPSDDEISASTKKLNETLASFGVEAAVSGVSPGPVITRYEIKPMPGVKVNSIVALSNDIALAMKARGIRVEAPIPGKDAIGFEIPNEKPAMVYLREALEDAQAHHHKKPLTVALGRYAEGALAYADIEKMPHVLVAGATNSGKSICLQSMIISLLYRNSPDKVKFLMIDPKRLELTFYEGIPHLYDPNTSCEDVSVVTDPKKAVKSLQALVKVMEIRYQIFEAAKVKNIESYNRWAKENNQKPAFYIVVVIDELADLMLQTKATVEDSIQRLAQMARAVGIHLVLCTQRPSVDVITGVIKANLPSRIALQVASKTDSRVILDSPGADSLLGRGDMLYLAIDAAKPSRIQGAYVSEEEITRVVDFLKAQGGPDYPPQLPQEEATAAGGLGTSMEEFSAALRLILERRRVSQDLLKAHFGSSARATNILSILEMKGFIHKPEGSNRWEIAFDKIEHQLSVLDSQNLFETAGKKEGENQ